MYLILHMLCIVIGVSGYTVYGQEHQAASTGSDPSHGSAAVTEHPAVPQNPSEQNQIPVASQTSSPDEQKMHEEWLRVQQAQSATPASVPHEAQPTVSPPVAAVPPVPQEIPATQPVADEQKMHEEWLRAQQAQSAAPSAPSHNMPAAPAEIPHVPQQEAKPKPAVPVIEEIKGIDTVDLEESRGNWLFKRIWWERAEQKYEKIRLLVEKIIDSRMEFFEKRTHIDREILDPFKHGMGMEQGELKTIVDQLIAQLRQEQNKEGMLNVSERDLLQLLNNEKKSIEQLQGYLETITKLDVELDEALKKLLEQINVIRRYERDAWQQFKDIARVLSDTKARELYHNMDVAWTNIQEVQEYLQEPFKEHFDHLINMITTHVDFIKNTVQALKEKGIDLQARMKAQMAAKPVACPVEEEEEQEEAQEQGFIAYTLSAIGAGFKTMWDYAVYIVTWPYMKLFGPAQPEYEDEESQEEQEQEAAQAEQSDVDEQ